MNLLARREHSLNELQRKLRSRFADEALVLSALQQLRAENLQSDERFAEDFVRQRVSRGYGPLRVRQELREKGLPDSVIAAAVEAVDCDWCALAATALRKKFGEAEAPDIRERARRVRFLQYRGFSTEHFRYLLAD